MWLRRSRARRPHPPPGTDQGDAEPPSRTPYYNTSAVGMAAGAPCSSPWGSSLPIGTHSPSGSLLSPPSRAARYSTGVCGDPPGCLLPPSVLPRAVLLQRQLFLRSPSTAGLPKSEYVPHRDPPPSPTGSFIGNFIFFNFFFVKGGCLNTAFPG